MADGTQKLTALFFLKRYNGDLVPLVAVDELPDGIVLEDVPRRLSPDAVEGMYDVGIYPIRKAKHSVRYDKVSHPLSIQTKKESSANGKPKKEKNIAAYMPTQPARNTQQDTNASEQPMSSVGGVKPWAKEYCSYWLRKGECDYAQQGCLYKHEMPEDVQTLNQLGLRDIPQWYRNQYGVGSILAVPGSGAALGKEDAKSKIFHQATTPGELSTIDHKKSKGRQDHHLETVNASPEDQPVRQLKSTRRGDKKQPTFIPRRGNGRSRVEIIKRQDSVLVGQPKLRRGETIADRQALGSKSAADSEVSTADESGTTASKGMPSMDGPPTTVVAKTSGMKPRGSISSRGTDFELQLVREDEERWAREEAAYQAQIQREKAERESKS